MKVFYLIYMKSVDPILWEEEVQDHICSNFRNKRRLVSDQISCQKKCELDNECVGISYSHNLTSWCVICFNRYLIQSRLKFGFYGKPGMNFLSLKSEERGDYSKF